VFPSIRRFGFATVLAFNRGTNAQTANGAICNEFPKACLNAFDDDAEHSCPPKPKLFAHSPNRPVAYVPATERNRGSHFESAIEN